MASMVKIVSVMIIFLQFNNKKRCNADTDAKVKVAKGRWIESSGMEKWNS